MKKDEKWVHYAFADKKDKQTYEFWWHPTEGTMDLYVDGVLQGKEKK